MSVLRSIAFCHEWLKGKNEISGIPVKEKETNAMETKMKEGQNIIVLDFVGKRSTGLSTLLMFQLLVCR